MPRTSGGKDPIAKYEAKPPSWLIPTHGIADLGYHGFHPPHPEQEEDLLSDQNVKNGYSAPQPIGVETFTSHNIIRDRFVNENALSELEDLMNQVLARRAESHSTIPEHAFKLPQRTTLSEIRRQAWQTEFFNSSVPLHTIAEKIPHAKGHDLLTLLQEKKVPVSRAVWYVRGLGGNETQGMRNRPNYNPAQYSVEWANVVTSYFKKLLAEVALPSAARLGLNIKQTFKGVLNDPDTRDKWVSKICYSLDLLREFYAESLVDHGTFLSWLAQQLSPSNLAQANFVALMADEYLEGMLPYRALQRAMIDGCLLKLNEIQSSIGSQHLTSLATALSSLLQRIFIANPDFFVNPRNWINHGQTITQILDDLPKSATSQIQNMTMISTVQNNLEDIARRNDMLLFHIIPERATVTAKFTMSDVKLLNSINEATNLSTNTILDIPIEDADAFINKLGMLLMWTITPYQYGDHRPYAVATLLARWRDRSEDRALRRGFPPPHELLQDYLFDWLDSSDFVTDGSNLSAMVVMFGELVARGLFSYSRYIQRLIARGEKGLLTTQEPPSRHRILLRCLPLYEPSTSLVNQRKVTLYGISCRITPEETREREIRRTLRASMPELFGSAPLAQESLLPLDWSTLTSASRYEQIRVLQYWFAPIFDKYIQRSVANGDIIHSQTYVSLTHILTLVKSYDIMLDINLKLLTRVVFPELLNAIIDTLRRHADIWVCMDAQGRILDALCAAHETWNWGTRRAQSRSLLCLLIQFHDHPRMPQGAKARIAEDAAALMQGLRPPMSPTQRELNLRPRIAMLAQEDDTSLATNIWLRYGFSATWVQEVWHHTLESLRDLPSAFPDMEARHVRVLRYAQFLWDIDQHLRPSALDELVLQWAEGPGRTALQHLEKEVWSSLAMILLYLVAREALTAPSVMKGIVYPIWELSFKASAASAFTMLQPVNDIASRLLIHDGVKSASLTIGELDEIQKLQTRRRGIYSDDNFSLLVNGLLHLVMLEQREELDDGLRASIRQLRTRISTHTDFRMVAYSNLELVSRVFWSVDSESFPQELEKYLSEALQQILSDYGPSVLKIDDFDWHTLSSFLSPWRYGRTAIELQLALRSLGVGLRDEATREKAEEDLCKFGSSFFGENLTKAETDLIADLLRGISGVVACKLVNSGVQRMTHLFEQVGDFSQNIRHLLHNAGEALHLMSSIIQPLRTEMTSGLGLPHLEADVQNAFVDVLHGATGRLNEFCANHMKNNDMVPDEVSELVVMVARFWQFDLCLPGAWTPRMRDISTYVLATVVRLAITYGCGKVEAPSGVFEVLIDTAFLLFDEIPRDTKSNTLNVDLFQYAVKLGPSELPLPDIMPPAEYQRVRSLLGYVPDDAYVNRLTHAWQDNSNISGGVVFGAAVQDHPWEWAESIEPSPLAMTIGATTTRDNNHNNNTNRPELRNSSSLPLELFGTRPTGERVMAEQGSGNGSGGRAAAAAAVVRQFEDGLAADNIFERDWRETRVNWKSDSHAGVGGEGADGGGEDDEEVTGVGDTDGGGVGGGAVAEDDEDDEEGGVPLAATSAAGAQSSNGEGTIQHGGGSAASGGSSLSPSVPGPPTARSQRSSIASSSAAAAAVQQQQRAGSVLSTSSRGGGGGGSGTTRSSAGSAAAAAAMRIGSKRKASTASLDLEPPPPPAGGSSSSSNSRRGRGRGKTKKK